MLQVFKRTKWRDLSQSVIGWLNIVIGSPQIDSWIGNNPNKIPSIHFLRNWHADLITFGNAKKNEFPKAILKKRYKVRVFHYLISSPTTTLLYSRQRSIGISKHTQPIEIFQNVWFTSPLKHAWSIDFQKWHWGN